MEIADTMHLTRATVDKDIRLFQAQARETVKKYLDQYLPEQFQECILGLDKVRKIGWQIIHSSQSDSLDDKRMRLAGAELVNDCISRKAELLGNVEVIKKESDQSKLGDKLDANEIPAIEVKNRGNIFYLGSGIHRDKKTGIERPYTIIGTNIPVLSNSFEQDLDDILTKYEIPYLSAANNNGTNNADIPIEELFKEDFRIYEGHNRHKALMRYMESLLARNKGGVLSEDQIIRLSHEWNDKHCVPPLDDIEFNKQYRCAKKFTTKNNNNNNGEAADNTSGSSNNKNSKQAILSITDKLLANYSFKTFKDTEEILYYDLKRGIYISGGESLIKSQAEKEMPEISTNQVNEILNHIIRRTYTDRKEFDSKPEILNLKNGLLDIRTKELKEHTPDHLSLKQWPMPYNPEVGFPKRILQFFREIQDRKGVITLIKMFGYILMIHSAKYEKAFMFIGIGDNGKSVLIKLIDAFVALENRSCVKLQDLTKDRFMAAKFFNKTVNTYADIPSTDIVDSSLFKILVSGDSLYGQNKYSQVFDFRNYAKLIFSANKIPRSYDDDEFAYFRRWVILQFNRKFEGINKDRDLIDKLTTEEELSGLLNLALCGLKKLESDGGFEDIPIDKIKKEYEREYDSINNFLKEECTINLNKKGFFTPKTDFKESYLKFCELAGVRNEDRLSGERLDSELAKHGIFEKRPKVDGSYQRCYSGVMTKDLAYKKNLEMLESRKQGTL
jgi:P4 family phage/plasmid primase-like protien